MKKIASGLKRNVVPDRIDLRDRFYLPTVAVIPGASLEPKAGIPVLFQGDTTQASQPPAPRKKRSSTGKSDSK